MKVKALLSTLFFFILWQDEFKANDLKQQENGFAWTKNYRQY